MPPFEDGEKTEAPTPRKRADARRSGRVAKSQDVVVALMLLAIFGGLYFFAIPTISKIGQLMSGLFAELATMQITEESIPTLFGSVALNVVSIVLPFMLLSLVAGVVANLGQIGFLVTGETVKPNLNKLNPLAGLKRLFSLKAATRTLFGILKISVVGAILMWTLWEMLTRNDESIVLLADAEWGSWVAYGADVVVTMGLRAVVALLILSVFDVVYQRWQYEKDLRMTKQELREEMHRLEGDPKVKERRRKVHQQIVQQRMMHEVPGADVVVTNPTHYAVAVKYDQGTMTAPRCVAKGEGFIAQRIREIALENDVPIVGRPELARTLFRVVEIGEEIPREFYTAIAEMLAYVYRIARRRPATETSLA